MSLDTVTNRIDNLEDVIDSRDVIARVEEMQQCIELGEMPDDADAAELAALQDLALQGADVDDWQDGAILVRETYFVDYIRETWQDTREPEVEVLASRWPFNCIDWELAARDAYPDYSHVSFGGVTYLVR